MLMVGMTAIGRNLHCPCGSGRKHKKCCLPLLDAAEREGRQSETVFRSMLNWVAEEHSGLVEEAADITWMDRIMGGERQRLFCALWAIIDYLPSDGGSPLAARFIARADLGSAERDCARRLAASRFAAYRVESVVPGAWIVLKPLVGGEPVRAISRSISTGAEPGTIMLTRLITGSSAPVVLASGTFFEAGTEHKWATLVESLPTDRSRAGLELLRFQPDDHADPPARSYLRFSSTWSIHDDVLVVDELEDDPLIESLGQEIGGGWAFGWHRPGHGLRLVPVPDDHAPVPDDPEDRVESARIVVDTDCLTIHAAGPEIADDLTAYLQRRLRGLLAPSGQHHAA